MKLILERVFTNSKSVSGGEPYTIGHLYYIDNGVKKRVVNKNGKGIDVIEDYDRLLINSMTTSQIQSKKVYSKTCIPYDT